MILNIIKAGHICYFILHVIYLYSFCSFIDLFSFDLEGFIFTINFILCLIFYGFTAFRDPGFVIGNDYVDTDQSQPHNKKKFSSNIMILAKGNIRTSNHQEDQIELQIQQQKDEKNFDMQCEASVDEGNNHEIDINNLQSIHKSPESHSYTQSKQHSPKQQQPSQSTKPETAQNKLNDSHVESPQYIDQSENQGHIMFIEKRYCKHCNQEALTRSKHCYRCGKCVALFDHHCPWAGNCIGEKNKCVYYWFLFFQLNEMLFALIKCLKLDTQQMNQSMLIKYVMLMVLSIPPFFMVLSLLLFHTLLSFRNLTTCITLKQNQRGVQILEEDFLLKRLSSNNWISIQLRMVNQFEIVLSIFSAQINTLGIQSRYSEYQMKSQLLYEYIDQNSNSLDKDMDAILKEMNDLDEELQVHTNQKNQKDQIIKEQETLNEKIKKLEYEIENLNKTHAIQVKSIQNHYEGILFGILNLITLLEKDSSFARSIQDKDIYIQNLKNKIQELEKQCNSEKVVQTNKSNQNQISFQPKSADARTMKELVELQEKFQKLQTEYEQQCQITKQIEDVSGKKIQKLQSINQKLQTEIKEVKQWAQIIIEQRSDIEEFLYECLRKFQSGEVELNLKYLSQQQVIRIMTDILEKFNKK
ncbi:hypothetical protein pb186bvf_003847 [Paramecium bursaria]